MEKMDIEICVKVDKEYRTVLLENINNCTFKKPIMIFSSLKSGCPRIYLDESDDIIFEFGGTPEMPTYIVLEVI